MSLSGLDDGIGKDCVIDIVLKGMEMTEKTYRDILILMTAAVGLTVAWAASVQAAKQPEPTAYLTPETAGPDFKVQGEYLGTAGEKKIGVQVIALGNGAFQAVIYPGGLPGAGWDGQTRHTVDGKTQDSQTLFAPSKGKKRYMGKSPEAFSALSKPPVDGQENYALIITGTALTGKDPEGRTISAKKIVRASPTIGATPPSGAIILFDGKNTEQWKKGQMDDRQLLYCGTETMKPFGSFIMHAEFRTPFRPAARSQGRGNSGIYIQRRYEVQVLDSFGLSGEANECGGLYRQVRPLVNMALPPLTWQTYDIDFTAAKFEGDKKIHNALISVRHNGVVIHDALTLKNKTGAGRKEGPAPGPIYLQGHGNPVFYRNIWIVEKK